MPGDSAGAVLGAKSPFRAILGNASLLVGGRTVTGLLSLVYIALAARGLGVEQFGILTLIHTYAQTIGDVTEFQSWQSVLHYGTEPYQEGRRPDLHRVIRFSMRLDAISALGGTVVALVAAYAFAEPLGLSADILVTTMLYATSILFMSSTTPIGVLRLMNRFDLIAVQTMISSLTRLVGSVVVYALDGGLTGFLLVWYASTLCAFVFMVVSATMVMRRNGSAAGFAWRAPGPMTERMPGAWAFMWNVNATSSLGLVTTKIALLAVGAYFGPREAALFRIARQLSDGVVRPTKLLVPALYPELVRLWAVRDVPRLQRLCLQIGGSAGLVATAALLILAVFGGPLITLLLGPEYREALGIMLWLFSASVITVWGLPLEPLLISTGRSSSALRVRAMVAGGYLVCLFPAMGYYGLTGAGVAALGAAACLFALQLRTVLQRS